MAACAPTNVIWPHGEPELTDEQLEVALAFAWGAFSQLTAYQVLACPKTVRPCGKRCGYNSYTENTVKGGPRNAPFWPQQQSDGSFINVLNCQCNLSDCECTTVQEVILAGPVAEVQSVIIGGITLDPDAYRIDNGNRLVRQDGEGWPFCQDLSAPAGEVDTWTVTYFTAPLDDVRIRYAVGTLAAEYAKAILEDDDCRLPAGTTSLIRQGITMELEKDLFEQGITGIPEVDSVTSAYNPFRAKLPAQVFSLDRQPPRQTTSEYQGS